MLDENLPTYRFQPSSSEPLTSLLYFTHNGSPPEAHYLLKRLPAQQANNAYAVGLLDVTYPSLVYAEVAVQPEWSQPTLSAAEIRAQNGASPPPVPVVPDVFSIHLYNPDQEIAVRRKDGRFGKQDSYEFEVPERTFAEPTGSKLDEATAVGQNADLTPKVVFRWKRDGRLSRDMTCYMCGRSVGGKKSKEPDITVALFRGARSGGRGNDAGSAVTIYEPNMARVEIEDRKGLEVVLMISSEVIKEVWQNQKGDVFHTATAPPTASGKRRTSGGSPPQVSGPTMSGAINAGPSPPPPQQALKVSAPGGGGPQSQAGIDAETRRLQAMVDEERRQDEARGKRRAQEQERRDAEEAKRMQKQLEKEDKDRRRREAEVEKETERLRKQYGVQPLPPAVPHPSSRPGHSPNLPPRPGFGASYSQSHFSPPSAQHQGELYASGGAGGYPTRPQSVGPPPGQPHGLGLSNGHYNGPAGPVQTGPPYNSYKPGQGSNPNQNQGKKKSGFGALLGVGKSSGNDNGNKVSKRKSMIF